MSGAITFYHIYTLKFRQLFSCQLSLPCHAFPCHAFPCLAMPVSVSAIYRNSDINYY